MTTDLRAAIETQAQDEGLWFIARTAPEAYLQQELRRLHALVEAALDAVAAPGLDVALQEVVGEPCRWVDIKLAKPYCSVHGGWWVYGYCDRATLAPSRLKDR